ncbi:MAG: hypothetical protein HY092_01130 [Candidatus Kerfeldbacteria bacterium]|nr:hypothetical protein [Candidatus Kerfeldbacteria bacterium]
MNPQEFQALLEQARQQLVDHPESADRLRSEILGRHGRLAKLMSQMSTLGPAERRQIGQTANATKQQLEQLLNETKSTVASVLDPTLPGERPERGHLHPLTQFSRKVLDIWRSFGYDIHEGPELETTWFNFETHSSTVQLRWPKSHQAKPPFKVVEVGKVYRHEATDATHESMFFQCDGVLVDRHVTMAHLVTTLKTFMDRLYPGKKVRIRPSYFPFVEPGIELDLWWEAPGKPGRWLEMVGAGLVHPTVIKNMGLKPSEWQGFAFGMGLDRLAMLEYGIPDVRLFYIGNLEFLKQF